jgi:glucose/arabinose dehydrogenase
VPFGDGAPTGVFETFAIGAESPTAIRFTGVGEGPDGSLYLAADERETIWRV